MNKHEYSSPSLDPAARLEAWYCWAASVLEEPAESLPEILEWPPGVPPFDGLLGAGQIRRLPAHPGLGDDPRVLLLQPEGADWPIPAPLAPYAYFLAVPLSPFPLPAHPAEWTLAVDPAGKRLPVVLCFQWAAWVPAACLARSYDWGSLDAPLQAAAGVAWRESQSLASAFDPAFGPGWPPGWGHADSSPESAEILCARAAYLEQGEAYWQKALQLPAEQFHERVAAWLNPQTGVRAWQTALPQAADSGGWTSRLVLEGELEPAVPRYAMPANGSPFALEDGGVCFQWELQGLPLEDPACWQRLDGASFQVVEVNAGRVLGHGRVVISPGSEDGAARAYAHLDFGRWEDFNPVTRESLSWTLVIQKM